MSTKPNQRGRPGKPPERTKGDYLDIRLEAAEKQAFRDAAELAGLDLSAWVREQLRAAARRELEGANRPVAFLISPPPAGEPAGRREQLTQARFVRPSAIELTFADGLRTRLPIARLDMPVDRIQWTTVKASPAGTGLNVLGVKGDEILIDSATLRYLVDKAYAAEVDSAHKASQFSRDELRQMARDNPPPDEWYAEPERDLTRESWK